MVRPRLEARLPWKLALFTHSLTRAFAMCLQLETLKRESLLARTPFLTLHVFHFASET